MEGTYTGVCEMEMERLGVMIGMTAEVSTSPPEAYYADGESFDQAKRTWFRDEDPVMEPEQFKAFIDEYGKDLFSGEPNLRVTSVVKTDVDIEDEARDEDWRDPLYQVFIYWASNTEEMKTGTYEQPEDVLFSDFKKMETQLHDMFEETGYGVFRVSLFPHEPGGLPLTD